MTPSESSRGASFKSKKSSKHDSDDEEDRPSSHRRSSHTTSSSKNTEKARKTSLLKSMFTRDHSEAKSRLASDMFRDESKRSSSSSKASKPKTEKARPEKIVEEETYTDEPDFSKFQSTYSEPVKEKKVEKKPEKNREEKKKKEDKMKEAPKRESKKPKFPVVESGRYVSRPIPSTFAAKTAFKSTYDISMAEKQTKIAELKGEELVEQEKWAREKLKAHAGTCPMGFNWGRFKQNAVPRQVEMEGYRCLGGAHFVTHELLSQGKGEVYFCTEQYSDHLGLIISESVPLGAPFSGQRWDGPYPASELPNKNRPPISVEEHARNLLPIVFGMNIHPAMMPQLQAQMIEKIKQDEKEDEECLQRFVNRKSSKGGPWWEDCH
ncbi:hypothetical protein IFR04_004217 [Cadophora malorum]|uniref:Uncharacterized protein n=1 Tax=Cadophora malorum TaxID=108018 RepID=A0A8H7WD34_9HELO|nr:hypothetical protein IFR04_004217 [Cadophora malorum]